MGYPFSPSLKGGKGGVAASPSPYSFVSYPALPAKIGWEDGEGRLFFASIVQKTVPINPSQVS
jgi:hypothetical protein